MNNCFYYDRPGEYFSHPMNDVGSNCGNCSHYIHAFEKCAHEEELKKLKE